MLDRILTFGVVIGPTLFALGVEAMSESIRKHRFWRYGVMAFGLILSGLTWWQISRQEANASIVLEKAVERVASETSERVTKVVGEQFQGVVTNLTDQIGKLKGQLAEQGKKVDVISTSNIVTGKKPIPVQVMNVPPLAAATAQVENMRMSWEPETSAHNDAPYAKKLTIQADAPVNPIKLAIVCDVPIKYGEIKLADPSAMY
jgi:hypothetical protein